MNKHYADTEAIFQHIDKMTEAGILNPDSRTGMMGVAKVKAVLALAYEQRTANLLHALEISARAQGTFDWEELKLQVQERLGL